MDGTLLNSDMEISPKTAEILNGLIKNGACITFATARTPFTAIQILKSVNFPLPGVFLNGSAIYDIKTKKYVDYAVIDENSRRILLDTAQNILKSGFVYYIDNDLVTAYSNADSEESKNFIEERQKKYNKIFTKMDSLSECQNKDVIYFSVSKSRDELKEGYEILKNCGGLSVEFYRDIYNTDKWYLETGSASASKKNGVKRLCSLLEFDEIVSFGDNLNDLGMFSVSNRCYAMANAKDDVKKAATGVIGGNDEDAVARFISEDILKKSV